MTSAFCEAVSLGSHEPASRSCFTEAQKQFEALICWAEASDGTLSEVEEGVEKRGRSVLRAPLIWRLRRVLGVPRAVRASAKSPGQVPESGAPLACFRAARSRSGTTSPSTCQLS
jgi:hypothetical protein